MMITLPIKANGCVESRKTGPSPAQSLMWIVPTNINPITAWQRMRWQGHILLHAWWSRPSRQGSPFLLIFLPPPPPLSGIKYWEIHHHCSEFINMFSNMVYFPKIGGTGGPIRKAVRPYFLLLVWKPSRRRSDRAQMFRSWPTLATIQYQSNERRIQKYLFRLNTPAYEWE